MDPFTQKILERAEQRSKTLGISKTTKFPLSKLEQETNKNENIKVSKRFETVKSNSTPYEEASSKSSISPGRICRQYALDKENVDVGIEINITTGTNVDVQVEVEEEEIDCYGNTISRGEKRQAQQVAQIRDSSRNRLQRLGALYSETDNLSSPIHRTEGKFHEGDVEMMESLAKAPKQKFTRFVALADSIKNWEDDTSHPDYKQTKNIEMKSSKSSINTISNEKSTFPNKSNVEITMVQTEIQKSDDKSTPKQLTWDKNVMDSLEAQGFQRRESGNNKISYEYKNHQNTSNVIKEKSTISTEKINSNKINSTSEEPRKIQDIKTGLVMGRAAVFEKKAQVSPTKLPQKDPAEMSLKERMMLFEKNKGTALIPKAAFAMPAPVAINTVQNEKKLYRPQMKTKDVLPTVVASADCKVKEKVAALTAVSKTISANNIKSEILKQRQEDMNIIANRFNKQKDIKQFEKETSSEMSTPPPPPPPMPKVDRRSEHVEPKCLINNNKRRSPGNTIEDISTEQSSDDIKRLKVNRNKPGRIYPVLSDFESTDTENDNCTTATASAHTFEEKEGSNEDDLNESFMESEEDGDICNVSLGREIMQAVKANEVNISSKKREVKYTNRDTYYDDSSINTTKTSEDSADVDDYLDEVLGDDDDDDESDYKDTNSRQNNTNGTTSSNSFSFKRKPKHSAHHQSLEETDEYNENHLNFRSPVKSSLTVDPSDDNEVVTLVHTVSFYRRQQSSNSNNSTPVRKINREHKSPNSRNMRNYNDDEDETNSDQEDNHMVQDKMKKLLDEVCKQQQVIGQTSQALNLCASTIEFSGSTESVEGERHLLVASHRRQAALDEVQRLRVEGTLRPHGAPKEQGKLTVKEITVPLRPDYIRKLSADTISGHHLVCLLKYNETVLATKTVPTLPGLIAVKFPDVLQLNNVYADFKIILEIYGMTAQREILPHEVKYHINLNKKAGSKTPKKKNLDSRLIMPMVQSPAGPNVVRTPALTHYGFVIFSLKEIQRNSWTLNQISGLSPLDGTVHMKIDCELSVSVEYKGFLTMFEDISGFGAWHRRWCHLNGHVLNYWKYPDDEKKKAPMGSIDLYSCCSSTITTAPRDVCARLNTLLLEFQRPAREDDVSSLLIVPKGKMTIVRCLLSADTKEERDEWSLHFNKILTLLRAWGTQ